MSIPSPQMLFKFRLPHPPGISIPEFFYYPPHLRNFHFFFALIGISPPLAISIGGWGVVWIFSGTTCSCNKVQKLGFYNENNYSQPCFLLVLFQAVGLLWILKIWFATIVLFTCSLASRVIGYFC